jgi:hypothetical protein
VEGDLLIVVMVTLCSLAPFQRSRREKERKRGKESRKRISFRSVRFPERSPKLLRTSSLPSPSQAQRLASALTCLAQRQPAEEMSDS